MKNRNWFWGIFFILAAVFVVVSQTDSFARLGFFSTVATIFLVAIMVESIIVRNFFGIFAPAAFLYDIYNGTFGLPEISIWLLMAAAVFASIGCSILFRVKPKKEWFVHHHSDHHQFEERFNSVVESVDDNNPSAKVSFGTSIKYLHADCLQSGQFSSSFGSLEVFFDHATLNPAGAEVFIDCNFGTVKLYIPRNWRVVNKLRASLGGIEDHNRFAAPDPNAPTLTLNGNVSFGSVEIEYI